MPSDITDRCLRGVSNRGMCVIGTWWRRLGRWWIIWTVIWERPKSSCGRITRIWEMRERVEVNVGQLVREKWRMEQTRLVEFSTHTGTVTAATNWDEPAQLKRVRPSLEGSWERAFHNVGGNFLLMLRGMRDAQMMREERLERAIGVIYRPETERISHFFGARIGEQFDAVIHIDETSAVRPLEVMGQVAPVEEEETFPTGI